MRSPLPAPHSRQLPYGALIGVVAALFFAREVLIPLALALLFSFLLGPLVRRLERHGLSRVPAVLGVAFTFFCVFGLIGWLTASQIIDLAGKVPAYQEHIQHKFDALRGRGGALQKAVQVIETVQKQAADTNNKEPASATAAPTPSPEATPLPVRIVEPPASPPLFLRNLFGPLLGPLGTAGVVLVFTVFMLIQREDLRDRLLHLAGPERLPITTQAVDEASHRVSKYLLAQVAVNFTLGVLVAAGLFIIRVPNAALWGLLAALLRFVPYIGVWMAAAAPLALSLATTDSWWPLLWTLGLFVTLEAITGNALEPWLYGSSTGLSPAAVIVAATFWTWLWGGVGLLLATPLTVCVAVIGKYIPSLSFLDALLGDEPTLTINERFYQRLLAMDRREACIVADEYRKDHTAVETYSSLFVPALAAEEREKQNGAIDERHQRFIFDTTRELMEDIVGDSGAASSDAKTDGKDNDKNTAPSVPAPVLSKVPVFCLPAVDEADEIVAIMLAHSLEREGYKSESLSFKTLANEMVAQVIEAGCGVVCVSATPPHDDLHTRYLCKLLRSKLPKIHIVVGLWDAEMDDAKLLRRRERLTADKVVTKLADALDFIRPLAVLDAVESAETVAA